MQQRSLIAELSTVAALAATRFGLTFGDVTFGDLTLGGAIIGGTTTTITMPSRAGRV